MHVPEDEKYLNSQAELHDMIVGLLGGRAAEEIVFDTVTTGASNDIEKATSIARSMVTRYGMSKRFGLMGLETVESQYLEGRTAMNCADQTAAAVDDEVMGILKECYGEALGMLRENRSVMDKIAAHLIEKETITGKEFMKIYREAKGLPEPEEKPKKDIDDKTEDKIDKIEDTPEVQSAKTPVEPVSLVKTVELEKALLPEGKSNSDENISIENKSTENNGECDNDDAKRPDKKDDYSQFGSAWEQNNKRY
jgi:cell division protease FtsH